MRHDMSYEIEVENGLKTHHYERVMRYEMSYEIEVEPGDASL